MAEEVLIVQTTWPEVQAARAAARIFIGEKLAACASLVPAIESIYRWEGKIETGTEILMILKTSIGRYPALEARLLSLHPYTVPEVLCLRVSDGLPAYLRWVEQSCTA